MTIILWYFLAFYLRILIVIYRNLNTEESFKNCESISGTQICDKIWTNLSLIVVKE